MTPRKAMIGSRFLLPNGIYSISLLGTSGSKAKPRNHPPTGFASRVSQYAHFGRFGKHGKQAQARRFFQGARR